MIWGKSSWQMRLPEIGLPYFGRLWQSWRWKLFLTSKSETQGPFSLPILHGGIHGHISSSSD